MCFYEDFRQEYQKPHMNHLNHIEFSSDQNRHFASSKGLHDTLCISIPENWNGKLYEKRHDEYDLNKSFRGKMSKRRKGIQTDNQLPLPDV